MVTVLGEIKTSSSLTSDEWLRIQS